MSRPVLPPDLRDVPPEEHAQLERVWAMLGDAPPATTPAATEDAWHRLRAQIEPPDAASGAAPAPEPRVRRDRPAARPSRQRRRWAAPVAALAVLAIVAVVGLRQWAAPITVQASGETQVVALPDGSTATLGTDATLTYRRGFGALVGAPEVRQVALVGEAFFDVESGEAPFVVRTFNAEVEVLGTRFGVRAFWREETTRVTVEEGRVRVGGGGESVELAAGEGSTVAVPEGAAPEAAAVPTAPTQADVERETVWREGGIAFTTVPLAAAFAEIERRFGVEIALGSGVPTDADVTAFYATTPDVRTVLGDLCAAYGLQFRATSRGFEVSADPDARPSRTAPS